MANGRRRRHLRRSAVSATPHVDGVFHVQWWIKIGMDKKYDGCMISSKVETRMSTIEFQSTSHPWICDDLNVIGIVIFLSW